ncbi:LAFE_0H07976g1_1 [Lachancea fermentati]|uniref:LAFE_0H07976g1_1 n=1 Tax=Lachancea fermentati TaxID=4955 RepID=A0A1G4MJY4_LACFM|nr:LAFE_0H07976g1_1 [Lachancea fermentati]
MVSTKEQWFNPSDMLDLTGSDQNDMLYNQTMDVGSKSSQNEAMPLPDEYFNNFLSSNYEEVDEFLTQELKDLDIPMIPERTNYASADEDLMNYNLMWQENNEDGDTPRKMHKRGPSGTAIFGFANHNKQLSISKMGIPPALKPSQSDGENRASVLDLECASLSKDTAPKNQNLNSLILKQQEELRLALEKQQEMNKKLEEQLRHSQIQQQQLQLALQEQEVVTHHLSANGSPVKTPSSKASQLEDRNIIVTSNSMTGSYQFPPPSMSRSSNGIISPISGTSINGSPPRRSQKSRAQMINAHGAVNMMSLDVHNVSSPTHFESSASLEGNISLEAIQKMSRYFEGLNDQISGGESAKQNIIRKGFRNSPITPQQQIVAGHNSSSSSPEIRKHVTKDSISSSASTIPQFHDDDGSDTESNRYQKVVGLGIQFRNDSSRPKYTLNKPPHLDLLPTIPGSTDNTPVGKKTIQTINSSTFPQKHVFQHTPTKPSANDQECFTETSKPVQNIFGTLKTDLRAPLLQAEDDEDDPESEFIQAQTPSPILKSQGAFDGLSPSMELHHLSPMKITRKPTTLPPGEIDKYVKELPDKTFECLYPQCGKNFKRRYNIRSHIQTHLEDRPYICDFDGCNKAFVRNHDLIRHKKTHAEKCYVCPCGKKFVREDALLVHRTRMICIGGKKFDNVVIKKSPRKRGRPRKDGTLSVSSSPIKETIARDNDGTVALKMEEQLRKELIEHGLLNPPSNTVNSIERERLHVV